MTTQSDRVAQFVDAVKDDPRVLGVAETFPRDDILRLLVVCTWDGGVSLVDELPRLGARVTPGPSRIEVSETPPVGPVVAYWRGLGVDGTRAELALRRAGDLVPDLTGRKSRPVHDPRGLIRTWIDASERDRAKGTERTPVHDDVFLRADLEMRNWPIARLDFRTYYQHDLLRAARRAIAPDDPAQAALAVRLDEYESATPQDAEGLRLRGNLEAFLAVADDEGFKGDRVLFGEAVTRLRDLSKREPVFDQGFVVPTFDAVEAAFALGEAVGGCQPPLVPGVYVGVGVTPRDALEFWAAPFVRDPTCSVACVDDAGDRDVVERAAGREPMAASLISAVDAAWERLPALIDRARDAAKEQVDPSAVLATLHLPKSFVERAKRRGASALMCSRLTVALAVARAGHDCAPLVARKLGLAAGRVLAGR
jgi:hypothetical protein